MAVLTEIDVDLAFASPDGAGKGGEVGHGLDTEQGQEPSEGARLLVRVAGAERNEDVEAGGPGGLDVIRQADFVEDPMQLPRDLHDIGERGPFRIEVEDQPVRPVERAEPRAPQMERDSPEIDHIAK